MLLLMATPAAAGGFELTAPVSGRMLRSFDDVGRFSAGHRGVDLAGQVGEPVRAAAAGTVHFAGSVAGTPSVSVDHGNGWRTTYLPVRASVSEGNHVRPGQLIGTLLPGHCGADACLHWGLTDGTHYADPGLFLDTPHITLLPMGSQLSRRPAISAARIMGPAGALPVSGPVTSPFGMRTHPVTGIYKLHDGADFGVPCGTPVIVPSDGMVTSAGYHGGYGYRIVVDHGGGLVTAYAHLPRVSHFPGERVRAGQQIAVVGTTGLSTGCHLHWMAWRGGSLVDPLTLVR